MATKVEIITPTGNVPFMKATEEQLANFARRITKSGGHVEVLTPEQLEQNARMIETEQTVAQQSMYGARRR